MESLNMELSNSTMECSANTGGDVAVSIKQELDPDELADTHLVQYGIEQPLQNDAPGCITKIEDLVLLIKSEILDPDDEDIKSEHIEEDEEQMAEEDLLLQMEPRVILLRLTEQSMAKVIEQHRTSNCPAGSSDLADHDHQTQDLPKQENVDSRECENPSKAQRGKSGRVSKELESLAIVINGRKNYCCQICQFKTLFCTSMQVHLRTHTKEKPHLCGTCGKGFTRPDHLRAHKRIHNAEKPFKCNLCSYACKQPGHLQTHMVTHTGAKSYHCTLCTFRCGYSQSLRKHLRTHKEDEPFKCTSCSSKFKQAYYLTEHMIMYSHYD